MDEQLFFKWQEIKKYWNQRAVYFQNVTNLSYQLPTIFELIGQLNGTFEDQIWHVPVNLPINASRINGDLSYDQVLSISLTEAQRYYNLGFSLCFGDLSPHINSINALKSTAASVFEHEDLIYITAYLSPPGAVGALHFDRQHNYFIQKSGCKHWYVSEKPAVINPPENLVYPTATREFFEEQKEAGYRIKFPKECGVKVFELQPGDILYVPPGYYHSPETGETASLHYTLTLEPACVWRDFTKLLNAELLIGNEDYYKDYRFLTTAERVDLSKRCLDRLVDKLQKEMLK